MNSNNWDSFQSTRTIQNYWVGHFDDDDDDDGCNQPVSTNARMMMMTISLMMKLQQEEEESGHLVRNCLMALRSRHGRATGS